MNKFTSEIRESDPELFGFIIKYFSPQHIKLVNFKDPDMFDYNYRNLIKLKGLYKQGPLLNNHIIQMTEDNILKLLSYNDCYTGYIDRFDKIQEVRFRKIDNNKIKCFTADEDFEIDDYRLVYSTDLMLKS
jgi:hypothetical protein